MIHPKSAQTINFLKTKTKIYLASGILIRFPSALYTHIETIFIWTEKRKDNKGEPRIIYIYIFQ